MGNSDLDACWQEAVRQLPSKIIVLDDDPTGVQTVHDVPVYASWETQDLENALREESKVVYILTNSRALSYEETEKLHENLSRNLKKAAEAQGMMLRDIMVVLRGDSTLRAHYPVELDTVAATLYEGKIDAEIHVPAFVEGGRHTVNGVHLVMQGGVAVPAAETEFAKDPVFGYTNSEVAKWISEKRGVAYDGTGFLLIDIEALRKGDTDSIADAILRVPPGGRIIVDATGYDELKVFCIALSKCIPHNKTYLFRAAASIVKILGGIQDIPYLTKAEINAEGRPGVVIAGSFVKKTSEQLAELKTLANVVFCEIDVQRVIGGHEDEAVESAGKQIKEALAVGQSICVYTSRTYFGADYAEDKKIENAKRISEVLIRIVQNISPRPGYIISKGGITSSDIGVKGLGVKRTMVAGQVEAGIPVWRIDEGPFCGMSYVIFPGNVGEKDTLKKIMEKIS